MQQRKARSNFDFEWHTFLLHANGPIAGDACEERRDIDVFEFEFLLARLEAREDEQILDQSVEAVRVFLKDGEDLCAFSGRHLRIVHEVFDVTLKDGKGSAEF